MLFRILLRLIPLRKSNNKKILDYVGLIINHLRKMKVGGFERYHTGILI